jgi:hypothetical protein
MRQFADFSAFGAIFLTGRWGRDLPKEPLKILPRRVRGSPLPISFEFRSIK